MPRQFPEPMIQRSDRYFRVKPGSFYDGQSCISHRLDENGNLWWLHLETYSSEEQARIEYDAGNLVDVTDDPTAPVFKGEPTESETVKFVDEDKAEKMPPVEDTKPRRKYAKKKTGGNK